VKTVEIEICTVYGNELIYPACPNAKVFAAIAGTKTLSRDTLTRIKALGYDLVVVAPTLKGI